ncbi:MAG: TonB-dependent receptor [Gammaproteobacteria bacterium]
MGKSHGANRCQARVATLALGVAAAIAAPTALAQQGGQLEEILVTAQFRSQNVQQTPIAITAYDAAMLEARGNLNIGDAANIAPNVQLSPHATGFGQMSAIFIRGVGQADPHFAVDPGVGMYIDDVYFGVLTGAIFELVDADRVEVLRGPQGTLAGKNSIGGAIKLFSQRPDKDPNAYAEVGTGSYSGVSAKAGTNLTLIDDKLYARVTAMGRKSDGYVTRYDYPCTHGQTATGTALLTLGCKLGTQGGQSTVAARGVLRWTPGPRVEDTFIFDTTQDDSENPAAVQTIQGASWAGTANYITGPKSYINYENYISRPTGPTAGTAFAMPDRTPLDEHGFSNDLAVHLTDKLMLNAIVSYRKSVVPFSVTAEETPASLSDQLWRLAHQQMTQEIRVSGGNPNGFDWTAGYYHYDADGMSEGRIQLPGGFALGGGGLNLEFLLHDPVQTKSDSVFAHAAFRPTEKLTITTGLRQTEDSKAFTFNRLSLDGTPHPTLGALTNVTRTFEGSHTDYRVAIDYQQSSKLMYYAQYSTGYKGGGVNPRPFFVSQALLFKPEELTAFEVGFKSTLADNRVRLNVALFSSDYSDVQLTLSRCDTFSPFAGAPCAMTANVGDARIKGVEAEVEYRPTENLGFDVSVGTLDFQYTRVDPLTFVTLDMKTPYVPDNKYSIGVSYDVHMKNGAKLTPRLDYSGRSRMQTAAINTPLTWIDSLNLANFRLAWVSPTEKWSATFAITNLTNEYYYTGLNGNGQPVNFSQAALVGRPRETWLTLRRSF